MHEAATARRIGRKKIRKLARSRKGMGKKVSNRTQDLSASPRYSDLQAESFRRALDASPPWAA